MKADWQRKIEGDESEDELWSLFHENSKSRRWDTPLPNREVIPRLMELWDALPYEGYERVDLPTDLAPLAGAVQSAILERRTPRAISAGSMTLAQLATLLHCAYGVTGGNEDGSFPRPFRAVPSAGALYPLELYFHAANVEGLAAALYHFNPALRSASLLRPGDSSRQIATALAQPALAIDTAALVFITAIFERAVFKYGNRGYRFTLLEAGHVAQNLNVAATALGLGCVNIGAFTDQEIDDFLGLDGMTHATLYLVSIGQAASEAEEAAEPSQSPGES